MTQASLSAINWSQALEQHRSWLIKVLRARIGDGHDVEDVYQEIVLAVLKQVRRAATQVPNETNLKSENESLAELSADSPVEVPTKLANGRQVTAGNPMQEGRPSIAEATASVIPTDESKVAPWLYRIAIRHVVNFYRRTNRMSHAKPCSDLNPFSTAPQPLDWILAVEQQEQLQQALASLRPQDLEVLSLKYQQNWTYQQMADHLGVPVRNIEYRLLNARKRLRKQLASQELVKSPLEATDS